MKIYFNHMDVLVIEPETEIEDKQLVSWYKYNSKKEARSCILFKRNGE